MSDDTSAGTASNAVMGQSWATAAGGWAENTAIFDQAFAPVTAALLAAADLAPGQRVLDVGCGAGTLLVAAVAAGAEATGVDISPGMAAAARQRCPDATVLLGDAQTMALPGPYDRVVSRFGVMFFADPVAAFANLRAAAAPGARLAFACWRGPELNPVFTLGSEPLTRRMTEPAHPPTTGSPGPVAFADHDRLVGVLADAGWAGGAATPLNAIADYGVGDSDGVEERVAVLRATSVGRVAEAELRPRLGESAWADALDEVRTEVRRHLVDGVVRLPLACWIATASNPG